MNPVVEEMLSILEGDENTLMHYGVKRRSGRYPWGSGKDGYQRGMDFYARYEELKNRGFSDKDIARELGMLDKNGEPSTGILRMEKAYAKDMRNIYNIERAKSLAADGKGPTEIGREMGVRESTVRGWLDPGFEERTLKATNTAMFLQDMIESSEHGMIDVGKGAAIQLGLTETRLKEALYILEKEGYNVYTGGIAQPTNPGQQTIQKVLAYPDIPHKEIWNYDKVLPLYEHTSHDGGDTFEKLVYPKSMDSKRLKVLLKDEVGPDGERGVDKDGIIQIRRGVDDLSLGSDRYAQVRILVDDKFYLKGMAVYSDNMPDGVDVLFNSNKTSYEKALKKIKVGEDGNPIDPVNPFGSAISPNGQSYYVDKNGNKQLSLINKCRSEGDWSDWTDALPSQFLSKQNLPLIEKQLTAAKVDKYKEYEAICSLENPTIKKHFLNKFADSCDAAAVDLKAAALPGQKYHVMIPINSLKDNEVYAPNYENGTQLALIRYPHAGTFEIPIVTVNNKHASAKKIIGTDTIDGIGVTKAVAERLSGADFDGDTVMCIPTNYVSKNGAVKITSTPMSGPYKELEGFDPQMAYPKRPGMTFMKVEVNGKVIKDATQSEMGKISNLITDMTLRNAPAEDVVKAVKHSMVVIDAGKHELDYKRSEVENDIARLRETYQIKYDKNGNEKTGGASTIISRASGEETVNKRQGTPKVNQKGKSWYDPSRPEGALIYKEADDLYYPERVSYDKDTGLKTMRLASGKKVTYNVKDEADRERYEPVKKVDPDGTVRYTNKAGDIEYRVKPRTQSSTKMAETDDAYTLVSKMQHPKELAYADYANSMKALANTARLEALATKSTPYSASAKRAYQTEVSSLESKLNNAQLNAIAERAALRKANVDIETQRLINPDMSKGDLKKLRQRAVTSARADVGALTRKQRNIDITDREWEAIQAGAITKTKLEQILNNTDTDRLRDRAMPSSKRPLSSSQISSIKAKAANGISASQLADIYGVSTATIYKYLKGANE